MERVDGRHITTRREPFFEIAAKYIGKDDEVLDIGSGTGRFAKFLDREDVILFDGNPTTVNYLRNCGYRRVIEGRLPVIPVDRASIDLVHCSHIIEHLEPDVLYATLLEIDRILKIDGCLVISAPLLWSRFYDDLSHVRPYTPYLFKKYMCLGETTSTTRATISGNYRVEEEVYRYSYRQIFDDCVAIKGSTIGALFVPLFHLLQFLISGMGIKKVEKSGFTLVLRKT